MALLKGVKPVINVLDVSQNNALKNMSEQDKDNACVKMLLNSYSDDDQKGLSAQDIDQNFNMMTSSNKSLLLSSTVIPANAIPGPANDMRLVGDVQNYIAFKEKLRYKLESPDNGVMELVGSKEALDMKIVEVNGYNLDSDVRHRVISNQDYIRTVNRNKNVVQTMLGEDSLFVYDKLAKAGDNNSVSLVSANSDSDTGLSLSMDKTSSQPESYPYGTGLVSYSGSKLTVVNSNVNNGNIVKLADGSSIENVSAVEPKLVLGENYKGGNYGQTNYENLTSFSVELKVSNDPNVTSCFTSDNNAVMLEPSQTQVNISELGESFPKSDVNVSFTYSLNKYPKDSDNNEVQNVLERVPLDNTKPELLSVFNANKTTDITIVNRNISSRMSVHMPPGITSPSASDVISETKVIYENSEKDLVNGFNTVLSDSLKDDDIQYAFSIKNSSTKSQYSVLNNNSATSVLLNGSSPARNLVFDVSEVLSVEVADDVPLANTSLTNLNNSSAPLFLDGVGADIIPESSYINVSLLRNDGVASANVDHLRILFQNILSDATLMAKRESTNQQLPAEDSITKISLSASSQQSMVPVSCSASFEVLPTVDTSKPYFWCPSVDSETMPIDLISKDALALKQSFSPFFVFGGSSLQEKVSSSTVVDSNGKRIYLPDANSINMTPSQQALSRDENGQLVYTDINSELSGFDVNDAKVELVSTDLDQSTGVRTVSAKFTHSSTIPTLKNHQVSYVLTYKYNELNQKWNWHSQAVSGNRGVRPQPIITLEVNSAFVFTHTAFVQGFSETGSYWSDLQNQIPISLNLAQHYTSDLEKQLSFKGTDNSFQIDLNISFDNTSSAKVLNNSYQLNMLSKPGNWVCNYFDLNEVPDSLTGDSINGLTYEHLDFSLNNVKDLLIAGHENGKVKQLSVTSSRSSANTTLQVSDVFKLVIPNNRLSNIYGYKLDDTFVSIDGVISGRSLFMANNSWLKIDDGVYIKSSPTLSLLSKNSIGDPLSTRVVVGLSLLNDMYSCVVPSISLRDIPIIDKVLVREGHNYSNGRDGNNSFKQISSLHRRGLKAGTYNFDRQVVHAKATWGSLSEDKKLDNSNVQMYPSQDPDNPYYKLVYNFDKSVNMGIIVNSNNVLDVNSHKLSIHYSSVTATMRKVYNNQLLHSSSHSTKYSLGLQLGLPLDVPFVENHKLNNFFAKDQTITFSVKNNDSIKVHFFDKYAWSNSDLSTLDKNGLKALALSGGATKTVTFTENDLILNNEKSVSLSDGKMPLKINYTPKLRQSDSWVCFSCVPEVLKVNINGLAKTLYLHLTESHPQDVDLGNVNDVTHKLSISSLDSSKMALGVHQYSLNAKPLLLTVQGSQDIDDPWDDPLVADGWASYTTYIDKTPFTDDNSYFTYVSATQKLQRKLTQSNNTLDGFFTLDWSLGSPYRLVPEWSSELILSPKIVTCVVQYVLGFNMQEGVVSPLVYKLVSSEFNPNKVNAMNKLASGVSMIKLPLASVKKSALNVDMNALDFPYNYSLPGQNYPSLQSSALSNLSVDFQPLEASSPVRLTTLDLLLKFNEAGSAKYNDMFAPKRTGLNKVVNIFSKDQLVCEDSFGNLCLRVGPDGRLYTGDVSTYSLYCNSQNSVSVGSSQQNISGLMGLSFNNNSVLNSIVQ